MHCHPASHSDANGRDFFGANPDTGESLPAAALHSKLSARKNDDLLQKAHIAMKVPSATFKIEDGIGDELTGAVPGGLSAAIDLENRMRQSLRAAEAGLIAGSANRINRLVLEKQKLFAPGARQIFADQPVLQVQRFLVFDAAKPLDFDSFHLACVSYTFSVGRDEFGLD